jgi:hypothetical protein
MEETKYRLKPLKLKVLKDYKKCEHRRKTDFKQGGLRIRKKH